MYDPNKADTFQLRRKILETLPNMFKGSLICAGSNAEEGTCPGDSGGPLIGSDFVDYETGELRYFIVGVLHGGIKPCDNSVYGAIYNRISTPGIHDWILDILSGINSSDTIAG